MASSEMTPLEALRTLVQDLYLASARPDTMMATSADYERLHEVHVLKSALDELAALRAWQERAVPLLAALAYGGHEGAYIETQARALLAESEASDGNDDALSPLPCGCHRLPPLACVAVKAHANPFAPWDGPVCDCPCHSGGVVVEARREQGNE